MSLRRVTSLVGSCWSRTRLIVERGNHRILGCHIVGERAVEVVHVAAVPMASGTAVEVLAGIPLSFPTYTNVLGRAAIDAARQLGVRGAWDRGRVV